MMYGWDSTCDKKRKDDIEQFVWSGADAQNEIAGQLSDKFLWACSVRDSLREDKNNRRW